MSCSMMAQTSTETIGKPVVIGKLAVAQFDFPKKMNWEDQLFIKIENLTKLKTKVLLIGLKKKFKN